MSLASSRPGAGSLGTTPRRRIAGRQASPPISQRVRIGIRHFPPRGWQYVVIPFVIGVLVVVLIALYNMPMFRVSGVQVRGTSAVPAAQVLKAANLEGRHIFEVSDRMVADSLVSIPRIKRVAVDREPPNTIVLTIEERKPWAIWQAGTSKYIIDDEGVVLDVSTAVSTTLPVLVYGGGGAIKPGARVQPEPVRLALQLDKALPERLKVRAKRFEYSENGGLLVITDAGWQARFGTADDLEYKLAALQAIVEDARARKQTFSAVDLRFGPRPFIR